MEDDERMSVTDWRNAALARLTSARKLRNIKDATAADLSAACYLAGYTVEMLLKAALMKAKGKNTFDEFSEPQSHEVKCSRCKTLVPCPYCVGNVTCPNSECGQPVTPRGCTPEPRNSYKTHDLRVLMKALREFAPNTAINWYFANSNKILFTDWRVRRRYQTAWIQDPDQAKEFFDTVDDFLNTVMGELML